MNKFKIGDRVQLRDYSKYEFSDYRGQTATITEVGKRVRCEWEDGYRSTLSVDGMSCFGAYIVGTGKVKPKSYKHLYRLKKDTLEHKAGTVVKEQCTDGDQDFNVIGQDNDETSTSIKRKLVVDNPEWFEEVKVTYELVKKRGRKPGKATPKKTKK
jgi:hypothetical protein